MAEYLQNIWVFAYLSGAWVNITADALVKDQASFSWGIRGTGPADLLADSGEFRFALKNMSGKYSPSNGAKLAGWDKGVPVKLICSYQGVNYTRFYGFIDDITLHYGLIANEDTADVTALDWMAYAERHPILSPSIELSKRADQALTTILAAMPINPLSTSFDNGDYTFPAVFDSTGMRTVAYQEFTKLIQSEGGRLYLKSGGELVFEKSSHRTGATPLSQITSTTQSAILLVTGDHLKLVGGGGNLMQVESVTGAGQDVIIHPEGTGLEKPVAVEIRYGKELVNRATVKAYPKRIDTEPQVLYSLSTPILIKAGETITLRGNYSNPQGGRQINAIVSSMLQPVAPGATNPYLMTLLNFTNGNTTNETGRNTWNANDSPMFSSDIYKDGFGTMRISSPVLGGYSYYGGYANYWLSSASSADYNFGSGAFTIGWYGLRIDPAAGKATMARDHNVTYPPFLLGYSDGVNLYCYMSSNGTSFDIANGVYMGGISVSRWTHYEVSRDSDGWYYVFVDGKLTVKWYSALSPYNSTGSFGIGKTQGSNWTYMGLDSFFILKGAIAHKNNFDPPKINREPTLPGDYWMNSAQDATGTVRDTDLQIVSVSYGSEAVTYQLKNNNASDSYAYIQARGLGVYMDNPIEDSIVDNTAIAADEVQQVIIDQKYQQSLTAGLAWMTTVVANYAPHRTELRSISFIANRSANSMLMFLQVDVGDLVKISLDRPGLANKYYYIQGVSVSIESGGIVRYTWTLQQDFTH